MNTRKIEIYTGNCPLCEDTVQLVLEMAGQRFDVQIYNIQEQPNQVHKYDVKAVPSIAIDGMLVLIGKPSRAQLKAVGLNQDDNIPNTSLYLGMGI